MNAGTADIERHGPAALIRVRDEKLTEIESPALISSANTGVQAGASSIILDMTEVRFMASAGIGALLEIRKVATEAGGSFVVFGLSDELLEVLKLTNLHKIFTIAKDEKKAVKSAS